MSHENCKVLFDAGKSLIEKSGLAKYCDPHFVACDNQDAFDEYWQGAFNPKFGRYMAWLLFSVGAENLAKAACVCNGLVEAKHKKKMEDYIGPKGYFRDLCTMTGICENDWRTLQKGYKRLKKVRDRDLHSYRPEVRSKNFPLVEQKFIPAVNILVEAMVRGNHQLPQSQ